MFQDKIKTTPLSVCFPEYTGSSADDALEFIKAKFLAERDDPNHEVFPLLTCATDTTNIAQIFQSVQDILANTTSKPALTTV